MGINIEYENFSYKQKDQFFTSEKTAKFCYDVFTKKLKELGDYDPTLDLSSYKFPKINLLND